MEEDNNESSDMEQGDDLDPDERESDNAQYASSDSDSSESEGEDFVQHNDIDGHWPPLEGYDSDDFVFEHIDPAWHNITIRDREIPQDMYRESLERGYGDQRIFLSELKPAYRRPLLKEEEDQLLNMTKEAKCTPPSPNRHGQDHPDDYWIKNWHSIKEEEREQSRQLMQEWNRDKTVSSSKDGKPFCVVYEDDLTL